MSWNESASAIAAPYEFRGRRMLVTGASGGIAAAVGTAFAELGAMVHLRACSMPAVPRSPRYVAATPLGRGGIAAECAGAFLFLACHGLSGFITGQTIAVNGGLSLN